MNGYRWIIPVVIALGAAGAASRQALRKSEGSPRQPSPASWPSGPSPSMPIPPMADLILSRDEVAAKAAETEQLLRGLAQRDRFLDPSFLRQYVRETVGLVLRCQREGDDGPAADRLMADLRTRRWEQSEALRMKGEAQHVEGVRIDRLELVHLFAPRETDRQEVAALITYEARIVRVGQRQVFSREMRPLIFQEVWTFRRQGDVWRVQEIEESHESDRLEARNYVERWSRDGPAV